MNLAGQGHTGTEVRILMSVGLLGFHVSETSRRGRGDNEGGRGGVRKSAQKWVMVRDGWVLVCNGGHPHPSHKDRKFKGMDCATPQRPPRSLDLSMKCFS